MEYRRQIRVVFALMALMAQAALPARAGSSAIEQSASRLTNGKHSYATLGPDFYTLSPPLTATPGARLALLDFDTARLLGLSSKDLDLVERAVASHFALTLSQDGTGKSYLATNYSNYSAKGPGRGDGRAALLGELDIALADGRVVRLDIVVKGTGRTKPESTDMRDGLLTLREAVHDFLTSKRNVRQNLDSTIDLGVLALPGVKAVEGEDAPVPAGLLIRIGQQTRPAHLGSQGDSPENSRKMLDYLVRRNLGLPMDHPIGPEEIRTYVRGFITNLGEEAARANDLGFAHGMMHSSNLTTSGGGIDYGTSRQMDGYHARFNRYQRYVDFMMEYLGFSPVDRPNRTQQLTRGTPMTTAVYDAYMKDPTMSALITNELSYDKMLALYTKTYTDTLTDLWLTRLGLTPEQIARVPENYRTSFLGWTRALANKRTYPKELVNGKLQERSIGMAEIDVQGALSRSLETISKIPVAADLRAYAAVFQGDRGWGGDLVPNAKEIDGYIKSVRPIIALLGGPAEIEKAAERARAILPRKRVDYRVDEFQGLFPSKEEKRLYAQVLDPKVSFVENSKLADQIVEDTIHHGLLPRQNESLTNLGALLYGERGKSVAVALRESPADASAEDSEALDPSPFRRIVSCVGGLLNDVFKPAR